MLGQCCEVALGWFFSCSFQFTVWVGGSICSCMLHVCVNAHLQVWAHCHIWKCHGVSFSETPFISLCISLNTVTYLIFLTSENVKMSWGEIRWWMFQDWYPPPPFSIVSSPVSSQESNYLMCCVKRNIFMMQSSLVQVETWWLTTKEVKFVCMPYKHMGE